MATAAKTTPQDLPPKGGYASFQTDRVRLRTVLSGPATIVGYFGITAASLYLYYLNYRKLRQEDIELRSSRLALWPMLIAERDREFLKQLNRNRREEAELMKNVPGWQVGTWYGEPIYKTVPDDKLLEPIFGEYFCHGSYKDVAMRMNIKLWS